MPDPGMVSQFFLIPVTKPSHLLCILGDVNDNHTSGNRTGGRWNQRQKGLDFMKRRYAAMILGLTLALTSVNLVCAADAATETTDTASDSTSSDSTSSDSTSSDTDASNDTAETTGTADAATEEDEIYGEVTVVDGSSIYGEYRNTERRCGSDRGFQWRQYGDRKRYRRV